MARFDVAEGGVSFQPAADGQALTLRYLKYLAHHPATARRIARKLAVIMLRMLKDNVPFNSAAKAA